jgi:uncharacterized protein (TIGR03435 family)
LNLLIQAAYDLRSHWHPDDAAAAADLARRELSFVSRPDREGQIAPTERNGDDVVDRTGLIFTALSEQLGLKLEREKVEGETFVVVRAEKPAGN